MTDANRCGATARQIDGWSGSQRGIQMIGLSQIVSHDCSGSVLKGMYGDMYGRAVPNQVSVDPEQ